MKQTNLQKESLAYQKIKANDKILQTLSELETVLRKLYDPMDFSNYNVENLIYKDRKGNEIVMEEFYEDLQHFIDRNETMLIKDSAENFETIKKLRK
jgi:hypothetical protein